MDNYQKFIYYVYKHIDNEEVVYVGVGTSCRAFRATGFGHRSKNHGDWLENKYNEGMIPVEFVRTGLSKKEALRLEKKLIKKFKPKYNKLNNPDYKAPTRFPDDMIKFAKELRVFGYSYNQIAYLMGTKSLVTRESTGIMSIWRLINER